jgi:acetyl esterase/lipase
MLMRISSGLVLVVALTCSLQGAPEKSKVILLWPGGAPGALGNADEDRPSLSIHLPKGVKAARVGVIVCPGGGYHSLAMDYEGDGVAEWLNSLGIAGFVLKYRLGPRYHHPIEMQDGQRAVRFVRFHAREYGIASDRIGIMGFSAGGHLASTIGTHFDRGKRDVADPIDRVSCRPDFMVLAYAVIALATANRHKGSMENLLGEHPDPLVVRSLSNELQVTAETPPTFLFHTDSDPVVSPENSVLFYLALRKNHVPAELHVFEPGRHGVGLARKDPALSIWPTLLSHWFHTRGLLK